MAFGPTARFTEQVNVPLWRVAAVPLQVTEARPESESETLPATDMDEAVAVLPSLGEVMVMVGGVLSRLMVAEAEAVFPATSMAVPEMS